MASHLNAAVDFGWSLPTTLSFARTRRMRPVPESQLSLALVANFQGDVLPEVPGLEQAPSAPPKRLGRPVRLRLHPEHETPPQRAERIANNLEYAEEIDHAGYLRPRTRADCMPIRRALVAHIDDPTHPYKVHAPCPFVSCEHHLHIDVHRTGDLQGMVEIYDTIGIEHTCVLDLLEKHGALRRKKIAVVLGVTEDRSLAMEKDFLRRMEAQARFRGDLSEDDL